MMSVNIEKIGAYHHFYFWFYDWFSVVLILSYTLKFSLALEASSWVPMTMATIQVLATSTPPM